MRPKTTTRTLSVTIIGLLIALVLASVPAPRRVIHDLVTVTASARNNYKDGEILCGLKSGVRMNEVARRHNLSVKKDHGGNQYLLEINDWRTVEEVAAKLSDDPRVIWAEPNYWFDLDQLGTDQRSAAAIDQRSTAYIDGVSPTDYFTQYAMPLIQAPAAHALATGTGVTVAVVDTGVDSSHPALGNVTFGFDFVDNDTDPSEVGGGLAYGHGTHVAGVVALVAPGATVMPVRAFDSNGYGDASTIASAIQWAAGSGADVINMSFGMYGKEPKVLKNAITSAHNQGIVLVASVGNDNSNSPRYPAKDGSNNVLAVAATDQNDQKASFSNYGSSVKVCAPGVSIYSAYPGGGWAWWDGTSFAAPMVSGEAALLLSAGKSNVENTIKDSAVNVGSGLGSGRIDCLAALTR
jgi:thermitase